MNADELPDRVEYYVNQLSMADDWDHAWHSLVELGPEALPYVTQAFERKSDRRVAVSLIRVVNEYRSAGAFPFLENLLEETDPDIWKTALDGIISLADLASVTTLRKVSKASDAEKREWIEEAIDQIRKKSVER